MERISGKIKQHLGICLMLVGVALFFGSLLGLANNVLWPEESLPYRVGSILVLVSLFVIIAGCAVTVKRFLRRRSEARESREVLKPPHVCRKCGADLTGYPEDVDLCSRCRARMEKKMREVHVSRRVRILRVFLGLPILVTLLPNFLYFGIGFVALPALLMFAVIFLLPIWLPLLVSLYMIRSKKSRLKFEGVLLLFSILSFAGVSVFPLIPAHPGLLLKKFLLFTTIEELFSVMPFITPTLTLTATIFLFSSSLMTRIKAIKPKTAAAIIAMLTSLPLVLVVVAPTQPAPGPAISISINGRGANRLVLNQNASLPPGFLEYNAIEKVWVYHISLVSTSQDSAIINKIIFDSQVLNAPFAGSISCEGVEKADEGIIFKPGARGHITITLNQACNKITFFDCEGDTYTFLW